MRSFHFVIRKRLSEGGGKGKGKYTTNKRDMIRENNRSVSFKPSSDNKPRIISILQESHVDVLREKKKKKKKRRKYRAFKLTSYEWL